MKVARMNDFKLFQILLNHALFTSMNLFTQIFNKLRMITHLLMIFYVNLDSMMKPIILKLLMIYCPFIGKINLGNVICILLVSTSNKIVETFKQMYSRHYLQLN